MNLEIINTGRSSATVSNSVVDGGKSQSRVIWMELVLKYTGEVFLGQ